MSPSSISLFYSNPTDLNVNFILQKKKKPSQPHLDLRLTR